MCVFGWRLCWEEERTFGKLVYFGNELGLRRRKKTGGTEKGKVGWRLAEAGILILVEDDVEVGEGMQWTRFLESGMHGQIISALISGVRDWCSYHLSGGFRGGVSYLEISSHPLTTAVHLILSVTILHIRQQFVLSQFKTKR